MKYNFEIVDTDNDFTITVKNIDLDFITKVSNPENINTIKEIKFYMYIVYDRITILDTKFTVLKNTKKCVVLLATNN